MKQLTRALALMLLITGCSKGGSKSVVVPPPVDTSPVPNTPANAVKLFEWAQENRDTVHYAQVFPAEFVFLFQGGDPSGVPFGGQLDREQELTIGKHMFREGSGTEPAATSISIDFDPTLTVMDDSRPGKNPTWHKEIRTGAVVTVTDPVNSFTASGFARFFLVRGDSATIPPDLAAKGFTPNSNRWWIEEWKDETILASPSTIGTHSVPGRVWPMGSTEAHAFTWGHIKAAYN